MPLKGVIYSSEEISELTGYAMSTVRQKIREAVKSEKINEFYFIKIGRNYALTSTGVKKVFGKTATEMQLKKMHDKENEHE